MADITREDVDAILGLLRDFPADGQLFSGSRDPERDLIAIKAKELGLIEERSSTKTCQACGASRVDHHWHTISPAGRALLAFAGEES